MRAYLGTERRRTDGPSSLTAVTTAAGLLLVVLGGSTALALAGAALWGLGTSLGFPVGISAAADDPVRAAARVSVVSSIGYTAFLAGPPLIGLVAESVGIRERCGSCSARSRSAC